jgi:hypothetical protein
LKPTFSSRISIGSVLFLFSFLPMTDESLTMPDLFAAERLETRACREEMGGLTLTQGTGVGPEEFGKPEPARGGVTITQATVDSYLDYYYNL